MAVTISYTKLHELARLLTAGGRRDTIAFVPAHGSLRRYEH